MFWAFVAASMAVLAEYLYRTLPGPWASWLWLWIPNQLLIGYSIYRLVTTPGVTLIGATVVWALCSSSLRVCATLALGDKVSPGNWAAFGLVILASFVKRFWR